MNATLQYLIGKICHIYIDDIVIWSSSVAEHIKHIDMVMKALTNAKLFCNKTKCKFFLMELDFLSHHISAQGVKPNSSKVQKFLDWPTLANSIDVCAFLGLVWYIAIFLPALADYTHVLTPLTTKDTKSNFMWTKHHQNAFNNIKALVISSECLTIIDHSNSNKKHFCHL